MHVLSIVTRKIVPSQLYLIIIQTTEQKREIQRKRSIDNLSIENTSTRSSFKNCRTLRRSDDLLTERAYKIVRSQSTKILDKFHKSTEGNLLLKYIARCELCYKSITLITSHSGLLTWQFCADKIVKNQGQEINLYTIHKSATMFNKRTTA
jgi:hypothetical protein